MNHLYAQHEAATRAALARLCPGFVPAGPATTTETSLLINGYCNTTAVVAKHPIDPRPFWQERCLHEIAVYRAFMAEPPPVQIPTFIAADPDNRVLVITRLPGRTLGPDRYPAAPLPPTLLDQVLDLLDALHAWSTRMHPALPTDDDYPAQLAQLTNVPVDDVDLTLMQSAQRTISPLPLVVTHGDPQPGNIVELASGDLAFIDLEATAWRPPGFDEAMLWTLLEPDTRARIQILTRLPRSPKHQAAFWAAALLICAREITSHRRHAPTRAHRHRLFHLKEDLNFAQGMLRSIIGES